MTPCKTFKIARIYSNYSTTFLQKTLTRSLEPRYLFYKGYFLFLDHPNKDRPPTSKRTTAFTLFCRSTDRKESSKMFSTTVHAEVREQTVIVAFLSWNYIHNREIGLRMYFQCKHIGRRRIFSLIRCNHHSLSQETETNQQSWETSKSWLSEKIHEKGWV